MESALMVMGVLTKQPGQLSNDFFVNLLDMGTVWNETSKGVYKGTDRNSNKEIQQPELI